MGGGTTDPIDDDEHQRGSSFRLEISIAVGYQRKRALLAQKWEGTVVSVGLLLGGLIVVLLVLWNVFQISL
jgi:hypothetical protein